MTSQTDRVDTILRQLHEAEHERREVASSGGRPDRERHNHLANEIRRIVGNIETGDLRSIVTVMVVSSLNGAKWPRCGECGRPSYLGEAAPKAVAS